MGMGLESMFVSERAIREAGSAGELTFELRHKGRKDAVQIEDERGPRS